MKEIKYWLERFFCVHHWIWGECQSGWVQTLYCDKCWKSKIIVNKSHK